MAGEINCCKCGKEIKGGHYNSPRGKFCISCYEKVPEKQKDEDLPEALKALVGIVRMFK